MQGDKKFLIFLPGRQCSLLLVFTLHRFAGNICSCEVELRGHTSVWGDWNGRCFHCDFWELLRRSSLRGRHCYISSLSWHAVGPIMPGCWATRVWVFIFGFVLGFLLLLLTCRACWKTVTSGLLQAVCSKAILQIPLFWMAQIHSFWVNEKLVSAGILKASYLLIALHWTDSGEDIAWKLHCTVSGKLDFDMQELHEIQLELSRGWCDTEV